LKAKSKQLSGRALDYEEEGLGLKSRWVFYDFLNCLLWFLILSNAYSLRSQ
jgi:hypothetical protein